MGTSERVQESPKLPGAERGEIATSLVERTIASLMNSPAFQKALAISFFSELLSHSARTQAADVPTVEGYCRVIVVPGRVPMLSISRYKDDVGNPLSLESCTIDLDGSHIMYVGTMPGEASATHHMNTREAVEGAENLIAFVTDLPLLGDEQPDALAAGDGTAHTL